MRAGRWQTTLTGPCTVTGRGYWSGKLNTLSFLPAPAGTGIRFVRTDLPHRPWVQATSEHRVSMPLRTRIRAGDCEIDMIEHVMAALYGLRIDNVEVHCTAAEIPGLDGSGQAYARALEGAGKVALRAKRATLVVTETMRFGNDQQWIRVEPVDGEHLELDYELDFGRRSPIGSSRYRGRIEEETFLQELAPARTFISQLEAERLQAQGLALHVTYQDLLVFDKHGPIDNSLRFANECARHKTLDLLGDLALAGIDVVGRITASRSGHQLNGHMAQRLRNIFFEQGTSSRAA